MTGPMVLKKRSMRISFGVAAVWKNIPLDWDQSHAESQNGIFPRR